MKQLSYIFLHSYLITYESKFLFLSSISCFSWEVLTFTEIRFILIHFRSHLVTVPPGPLLSEALINSPIIVGEDGSGAGLQATGFEFGVDPNEDPELALVCIS